MGDKGQFSALGLTLARLHRRPRRGCDMYVMSPASRLTFHVYLDVP